MKYINLLASFIRKLDRSLLLSMMLGFLYIGICAQPMSAVLIDPVDVESTKRVENLSGKSILVFTPHPDDETFAMGGTLARLIKNENNVQIIIYTNDNKGSLDLEMTSERLARIRRAEENKACELLGIAEDNIHWMGYEDGDLEYADPQILRGRIARLIKIYRPDVIFSPDPGQLWNQWHKTDHRMAANITQDAFIAAEWHLYYPQHLLDENLLPYSIKEVYFYYSQRPNYEVDITNQFDVKIQACAAHVSQFEPSTTNYIPTMTSETYQAIYDGFKKRNLADDGRLVERFRKAN